MEMQSGFMDDMLLGTLIGSVTSGGDEMLLGESGPRFETWEMLQLNFCRLFASRLTCPDTHACSFRTSCLGLWMNAWTHLKKVNRAESCLKLGQLSEGT